MQSQTFIQKFSQSGFKMPESVTKHLIKSDSLSPRPISFERRSVPFNNRYERTQNYEKTPLKTLGNVSNITCN
jgi:hypothetical protein